MAHGYYAKSMVVTRLTGIPYRQNDVVLSSASGRVLWRSHAVERLGLDEACFCLLLMPREGRYTMEVREDRAGLLGQHLRSVGGCRNMQLHARQMVRQWCRRERVDELRMRVTEVTEKGGGVRHIVLERVDDLCEMYHWDSRRKKNPYSRGKTARHSETKL